MNKAVVFTAVVLGLMNHSGMVHAQHDHHAGHTMPAAQSSTEPTEATVKKVDKAGGKVTLSHGPLKNLGMPPMTMAFKVKDAKALASLKEGDKIRFVAEQAGTDYLATKIEKAK